MTAVSSSQAALVVLCICCVAVACFLLTVTHLRLAALVQLTGAIGLPATQQSIRLLAEAADGSGEGDNGMK